jgi:hypothetical protein
MINYTNQEFNYENNNDLVFWVKKYFLTFIYYVMSTSELYPDYRLKWFTSLNDIKLFNKLLAFSNRGDFLINVILTENVYDTYFFGVNNPEDIQLLSLVRGKFLFLQTILKNMYLKKEFPYLRLWDLIFIIVNIAWALDYDEKGEVYFNNNRCRKLEILTYDLSVIDSNYLDNNNLGFISQLIRTLPFVQTNFEYNGNNIPSPYFIMIKDAHRCPSNTLDKENVEEFIRKDNKKFQWTVSINYHVRWHKRDIKRPDNLQRGPIFYREYLKKLDYTDNQLMTKEEWAYTFGRAFTFSHDGQLLWFNLDPGTQENPTIYSPQCLSLRNKLFPENPKEKGEGPLKYGIDEWLSSFFTNDVLNRNYYESKKAQNEGKCVDKYLIDIYEKSDFFQMYYGWDINLFYLNEEYIGTKEYRSGAFLFLYYICLRNYEIYGSYGIPNLDNSFLFESNFFDFSITDFYYYIDRVLRNNKNNTPAINHALSYFPPRNHIHNYAGNSCETISEEYHSIKYMVDWKYRTKVLIKRASLLFFGCFRDFILKTTNHYEHSRNFFQHNEKYIISAILGTNNKIVDSQYGCYVKKIIEGNVVKEDAEYVCNYDKEKRINTTVKSNINNNDIDNLKMKHEVFKILFINNYSDEIEYVNLKDNYYVNVFDRIKFNDYFYDDILMLRDCFFNHYSITDYKHNDLYFATKWSDTDIGNDIQYPLYRTMYTGENTIHTDDYTIYIQDNTMNAYYYPMYTGGLYSSIKNEKFSDKKMKIMEDKFLQMAKNKDYETLYELVKIYLETPNYYKDWRGFFEYIDIYTIDDFSDPINREYKDSFRNDILGYFTKNKITIESFTWITQKEIDSYLHLLILEMEKNYYISQENYKK